MTRLFALSALVPALMTSTALAADILQEQVVEVAPTFTLTGTIGVIGFDMPDYDTGVFGLTEDGQLWGGMIGASGAGAVSTYGEWDVVLGFNVFGAWAGGSSSSSQSFEDGSSVVISGLSGPDNGSLDVDAPAGGPFTGIANHDLVGNATIAAPGANANAAFSAPSGDGFIMGGATTNTAGTGDSAFAGIADTAGGVFAAAGDLSGLTVTTDVDRELFYGGGELTIGLGGGAIGDGTTGQVYIGPSYRGLFQSTTTTVTADMAESPGVVTLPNFIIETNEELDSHYFGGVLGGNLSFGAGDGVVFTLGLEGGVYGVHADWTGQDSYETSGGNFDPDGIGPDPIGAQPVLTVDGPEFTAELEDNIAFAARGNAAVTWAVNETTAFSLGGSLEYLSAVATVDSARTSETTGDTSADWSSADPDPVDSLEFGWGSMFNFALTASLTGTF